MFSLYQKNTQGATIVLCRKSSAAVLSSRFHHIWWNFYVFFLIPKYVTMYPEIQDEQQQIPLFLKHFWAEACVEQTW